MQNKGDEVSQEFKSKFLSGAEDMQANLGPAMCLAKWKQVSLHLPTGLNNSCYHPPLHPIDATLLADNPSALHNTPYKKEQRKMMMTGLRPEECHFCWQVEDSGHISDRIINSANDMDQFDVVRNLKPADDFNPKFIEVNFGNVCNFMCGYCTPTVSNSWINDIKANGNFPVLTKQYSIDFIKDREYYESDDVPSCMTDLPVVYRHDRRN